MKAPVRFLNAKGLGRFQEYLQKLREGDFSPPPVEILTDTETSMELPQIAEVEKKKRLRIPSGCRQVFY